MTGIRLEREDAAHSLDGTTFWFLLDGAKHEVTLRGLGERAIESAVEVIENVLTSGASVERAIAAAERMPVALDSMNVRRLPTGAMLIDDSHRADQADTAGALRVLAEIGLARRRTVAVLGEFDCAPEDYVEAHDAIGRLIVRLNIGLLVAVGTGARHLQAAAGLEGSWNGESVIVANAEEAYDLLREEIRENDVVLVKAAPRVGLGDLGDRLAEVMS